MQRRGSLKRKFQNLSRKWKQQGKKGGVKFSAKADNSECNAEDCKQQKRFSETDGLHIQNLAMVFLNFKNNLKTIF